MAMTIEQRLSGPMIEVRDLKVGDVIYGCDEVTKVYRHPRHGWRVVAETTGGEYSFPEDRRVPGAAS